MLSLSSPLSSYLFFPFFCFQSSHEGTGGRGRGTHWHCRANRASSPAAITAASAHFSDPCALLALNSAVPGREELVRHVCATAQNTPPGSEIKCDRRSSVFCMRWRDSTAEIRVGVCVRTRVCARAMQMSLVVASSHSVNMNN